MQLVEKDKKTQHSKQGSWRLGDRIDRRSVAAVVFSGTGDAFLKVNKAAFAVSEMAFCMLSNDYLGELEDDRCGAHFHEQPVRTAVCWGFLQDKGEVVGNGVGR